MAQCSELSCMLNKLNDTLTIISTRQNPTFSGTVEDTVGNWTRKHNNTAWFFEQTVTFAGSTMNVNLDFPQALKLGWITLVFNDATVRTFSINHYMNPNDTYYSQIRQESADTSLNYRISDINEIYPINARLQFAFSVYTVGKTCKISVQASDI